MQITAKIKSLLGLEAKPQRKPVDLRVCVSCAAHLEPSLDAVIKGEHRCDCGSMYKVISACADVSQLRGLDIDPKTITATTQAMRIQFGTKSTSE
jgi:hypothetical protein